MGQDVTESDRVVAKTNPGTVKGDREQRTRYPVLRDSRIAVPNGVSCVPPTKKPLYEKKHKNMDLNAYASAMAIAGVPRHKKTRQTVPEPEFKP